MFTYAIGSVLRGSGRSACGCAPPGSGQWHVVTLCVCACVCVQRVLFGSHLICLLHATLWMGRKAVTRVDNLWMKGRMKGWMDGQIRRLRGKQRESLQSGFFFPHVNFTIFCWEFLLSLGLFVSLLQPRSVKTDFLQAWEPRQIFSPVPSLVFSSKASKIWTFSRFFLFFFSQSNTQECDYFKSLSFGWDPGGFIGQLHTAEWFILLVELGQNVVFMLSDTKPFSVSLSTHSCRGQSATYWCPVGSKTYISPPPCCVCCDSMWKSD